MAEQLIIKVLSESKKTLYERVLSCSENLEFPYNRVVSVLHLLYKTVPHTIEVTTKFL